MSTMPVRTSSRAASFEIRSWLAMSVHEAPDAYSCTAFARAAGVEVVVAQPVVIAIAATRIVIIVFIVVLLADDEEHDAGQRKRAIRRARGPASLAGRQDLPGSYFLANSALYLP
jgi:hypothetical protein